MKQDALHNVPSFGAMVGCGRRNTGESFELLTVLIIIIKILISGANRRRHANVKPKSKQGFMSRIVKDEEGTGESMLITGI